MIIIPYKDSIKQKKSQHDSYKRNKLNITLQINKRSHRVWAQKTIYEHKRNGYIVNISTDELELLSKNTKHCKYCGCKLNYNYGTKGKTISNSPSMDRINNEKEINITNIQIICHNCNSTKRARTHREFVKYCLMIVKNFGGEIMAKKGCKPKPKK